MLQTFKNTPCQICFEHEDFLAKHSMSAHSVVLGESNLYLGIGRNDDGDDGNFTHRLVTSYSFVDGEIDLSTYI